MEPAKKKINRWWIAFAGTFLQLCLGSVYTWSYFQKPLVEGWHWTNSQVAWVFSLAICFLGLAAAWAGINLARIGPRRLAMTGGALFGTGYLLAALALKIGSLPLLYLGYGVIGGIGLGLGYVAPVATVAKWFPDKKGLVTGMVIMGFGFGALLMSKVLVPTLLSLTDNNLVAVFSILGVGFAAVTMFCGFWLVNPAEEKTGAGTATEGVGAYLVSGRFLMIWAVFFCNIVSGIAIIGFQSPMLQDLLKQQDGSLSATSLAAYGATLIAVSSLFNGLGRLFWGAVSDRIGRILTFRLILGTQIGAFLLLAKVSQPWIFAGLVCYVLLCYGGGFGTMPSLVMDAFGGKLMPVIYGAVLTAWSAAGIVGPQIVAWLKDHQGASAASLSFLVSAIFLAIGFVFSLLLSNSRLDEKRQVEQPKQQPVLR